MPQAELLLTIAQIGMALAGFAGLVTLLGRTAPEDRPRLDEIRFRSMVELSLALSAFALLPFVPDQLGAAPEASWRIASALYAAGAAVFLAHGVRRNRRTTGVVLVAGGVTAALIATCGLVALGLALDAFGAFSGAESGVYVAALFVHFLATAFFFLRLLYGALPRDGV